ncbi:BAH_G0054860.mRNA.1.CDS.1 [Saccharomyces cerevisiae]|nr:SX2_G0019930.mRNA.1.CDS.1 [Saccharomyces cerevisiae]CAD6651842.1 HLJ1_G0024360.mRNA.1.CDS.1 [Saccharomyces cerevisiae]CAI4772770.1 BMC_2a_G0055710.mRNA.1.CDS.1 [Saccharomyces cerevisiae]CAI4783012.1 BMB_G0055680.mRNA.1.CDS.1 [Saccharomyces cerevisiae]CAI4809896.1 CFA_G0055440.mRNA.1.CDS.1 [Saccharomyces cerevisiae]
MLLFQILCRIASLKEKICTKEHGFKSLINKNFPKIFVWPSEKTGNAHPSGFRPECLYYYIK